MPAPAPSAPQGDGAGDALSYRMREGLLAVVALVMLGGVVLADGRPRVTFGFFAVRSLVLIVNLERLRRKG